MRIIISPAKKMHTDTDSLPWQDLPCFLPQTEQLYTVLREMDAAALKALWKCNDAIAVLNVQRLKELDLRQNLTPAILTYEGIQYQYMAPNVFTAQEYDYIQAHLRILSGFYGILRPFDGVAPYRLEMQAKAKPAGTRNLYEFWGDDLYREVLDESRIIVNLASVEYSRCIGKYLVPGDRFITCVFGEEEQGKVVQKGVYAKMARGDMVRYIAEINAEAPEQLRAFDRSGYRFDEVRSTDTEYVFIRKAVPGRKRQEKS